MSTLMVDLRLPGDLQDRVFEFYDKINELNFITNHHIYELISPCLSDTIKLFQIEETVLKLPFINSENRMQIEKFTRHIQLSFFLAGDIVIKQGWHNEKLYYIHKGLAEAIIEHKDFEHFNHRKVEEFMHNIKHVKKSSKKKKLEYDSESEADKSQIGNSSKIAPKDNNTSDRLTSLFMQSLAIAKKKREQQAITDMKVTPYADDGDVSASHFMRKQSRLSENIHSSLEDSIDSLISTSKKLMNKSAKQDQFATKSILATSNNLQKNSDDKESNKSDENNNDEEKPYSKLMSPNVINLKKNSIKEKFHTTIITQSDGKAEESNFTVVNELDGGKYFGEISLLTNLPTTCSIHTVSNTLCATLSKQYLEKYFSDYIDSQQIMLNLMHKYNDPFFKTLHRIIKNIPKLSFLDYDSVRSMVFMMSKHHTSVNKTIIKAQEICNRIYFVYSGVIGIYVIDPKTKDKIPFQYLCEGSAFNFSNSVLGYYSLFEIISETECTLMWIDAEKLYEKAKTNFKLKNVLDRIVSLDLLSGCKYDYHFYLQYNVKTRRKATINDEEATKSNSYAKDIKLGSKLNLLIYLFL